VGYPLCAYALTDAAAERAGAAQRNQFHKFTTLKTAQDRYVVTPNNVTIDAYAQADLRQEPTVLQRGIEAHVTSCVCSPARSGTRPVQQPLRRRLPCSCGDL
jgi:hypothetical protein